MARTKPHNIFQRIICFNYVCRRLIGRNKLRQAVTYEDFSKQIKKNAKKGYYKNMTPSVPATPPPIKKAKEGHYSNSKRYSACGKDKTCARHCGSYLESG